VRTWAAAEKSLSTAAELGRVALLFLKVSAMIGQSNRLLTVADLEASLHIITIVVTM